MNRGKKLGLGVLFCHRALEGGAVFQVLAIAASASAMRGRFM
jgi:hypothetical protein